MEHSKDQQTEARPRQRGLFRLDVLLLAFLLVGWSLIFTTATLGLQRSEQQWLSVGLLSEAAADYSAAPTEAFRLARLDPEIIEAIKQDQLQQLATPTPSVAVLTTTPTPTATPTATPVIGSLAVSAGGPYEGEEGSSIPMVGENTSVLGLIPGVISYVWDLDNDGQYDDATGASASVIFYDEGEYPVSVQATDLLGRVDTDTTIVYVSNVPPLVNIGQDIETGEGQEVAFAATASDPGYDILFFEWNFGDGSPPVKDTLNPRHTYIDNELYTVRLRVKDNDGGITEDFLTVNVGNLPPLVNAGPDQVITEGSAVALNGTATDPGPLDKLTYAWDFNYDGDTFTADWGDKTASTVYPDGPAAIVAAFRARDNADGEGIDTLRITVNNVPPVITSVSNDGPTGEGSSLSLTVSATDVGNDPLTFAFDWDDDGTFDAVGQPSAVSNIWYNQGEYTVRIRVDDGDGGQAFTTTTVSTLNEPPIAIVNAESERLEGSPVLFDASDSYDPGLNDILTYQWDFGDGSSASEVNLTHVYADNKVYSATLTVTDDSGAIGTTAVPVIILNANPVANAGADRTVDEGDNVSLTFVGTVSDPGTADTLSIAWDCDDRNGISYDPPNVTGTSPTCVYQQLDGLRDPNSNSFNVALRVRDDDYPYSTSGGGEIGEAFDALKVTIRNLPPRDVRIDEPTGNPVRTTVGIPIRFRASGTDVSADLPLSFRWDFNYDGSTFTEDAAGPEVIHTWTTRDTYTVRLQVEDGDGGITPAEIRVNIGGVPIAEAGGHPPYPPYISSEGLPITLTSFSSDPDGDLLTQGWDFGDGTPPFVTTATTVTHVYTDDGIYTATLRVDDGRGGVATDVATVTVNNVLPTAVANISPNPTAEGQSIAFDGSSSSAGLGEPLTYQWNFGDGSPVNNNPIVTRPYADNGVYMATLTVSDDDGASDTATVAVTVNNVLPTAVANISPNPAAEGQSVNFNSNGSGAGQGEALTYQWNFGDGSPIDNRPNGTRPYADDGVYTATLIVTDDDGASATSSIVMNVTNVVPAITAANANPNPASEGQPVTFNGSASAGPFDTLTYQWDFGDGSPTSAVPNPPPHPYADNGDYTAILTVTDDDGTVATTNLVVTVTNAPPIAVVNANPSPVPEGASVTLDGSSSSDPGNDALVLFEWDFDYDGSNFNTDASGSNPTTTTSYPDGPATPTVALRVTDDEGAVSPVATLQVNVDNVSPENVSITGPDTVAVNTPATFSGNATDVPDDPLTYNWSPDGGGQCIPSSGQSVDCTWTMTGTHTIMLEVNDGDGGVIQDTATVLVNSVLPFVWGPLPYVLWRRKGRSKWQYPYKNIKS